MGNHRSGWRRLEVDGAVHRWRVGRARFQFTLGTLPVVVELEAGPRSTVHVACRCLWDDLPKGRAFDPAIHTTVTPALVRGLVLALGELREDVVPDSHFRWVDGRLVSVPRDCTILVGDRLFGFVERVEQYGAYVDVGPTRAIVLIPDFSWSRIRHPSDVVRVGEEVQFIAIHLVEPPPDDGVRVRGSIRALIPDPWASPSFGPGDEFESVINRVTEYGYWLRHPSGESALLMREDASRPHSVGTNLSVRIHSLDMQRRAIEVVEANPDSTRRDGKE